MRKGALLPFGGYKGANIALLVEFSQLASPVHPGPWTRAIFALGKGLWTLV